MKAETERLAFLANLVRAGMAGVATLLADGQLATALRALNRAGLYADALVARRLFGAEAVHA